MLQQELFHLRLDHPGGYPDHCKSPCTPAGTIAARLDLVVNELFDQWHTAGNDNRRLHGPPAMLGQAGVASGIIDPGPMRSQGVGNRKDVVFGAAERI